MTKGERPPSIPNMSHEIVEIPPHNSTEAEKRMSAEQIALAGQIAEMLLKLEKATGLSRNMLLRVGDDTVTEAAAEHAMEHYRGQKDLEKRRKAAQDAIAESEIEASHQRVMQTYNKKKRDSLAA